MHTFGELLQKKAKQQKLREERDREYTIIEYAKNILTEANRNLGLFFSTYFVLAS